MSKLFADFFSCSSFFNISQSSSGSDDKNFVFETPEAETTKPGDLSNFINVLSGVDFQSSVFVSKFFSLAKSCNIFYPIN